MILLHVAVAALYALAAWALWPRPRAARARQRSAAPRDARSVVALLVPPRCCCTRGSRGATSSRRTASTCRLANALSVVAGARRAGRVGIGPAAHAAGDRHRRAAGRRGRRRCCRRSSRNPHRLPVRRRAAGPPLHIAVALVAYALFLVAAVQALVLMGLEKRLHRRLPDAGASGSPPLLTLERFLFRLVDRGLRAADADARRAACCSPSRCSASRCTFTHKSVFSVLGWLTFGALLLGPLALRLARPRRAALDPRRHGVRCSSPTSAASSCSRCCSAGDGRAISATADGSTMPAVASMPDADPRWTTSRSARSRCARVLLVAPGSSRSPRRR